MSQDANLYHHWIKQIDHVILTEPNLDAILDVIFEAVKELSDATDIDILLAEGERLHLVRYLRPWQEGLSSVVENEHGVVAWVARNRKAALIHDVSRDKPWKDVYVPGLYDVCSELAVPILGPRNELIGVINLEHTECDHFSEEIRQKIESVAQQAAIGIDRARRAERLQRIIDEKCAIRELENWFDVNWKKVDERELYERILEFAMQITGADVGDVIIYDPADEKLRALVAKGKNKQKLTEMDLSLGVGIVGIAAEKQEHIRVPDVTEEQWKDIYRPVWPETKSELAVPIVDRRGEDSYLIGVINLESSQIDYFREQDIEFVQELAKRARRARRRNLREAWLEALVGLSLSAMKLDTPEEIVRLTLEKALELSKGALADLVKYDEKDNVLGGWAAERDEKTGTLKDFHPIPSEDFQIYEEGIMAQVARTKRAYLSNDVTGDEWYKPDPKQPTVRSELAVPLMRDENTLYGVFNIECAAANAFTVDDIRFYTAVAELLAPVLVLAEEREEWQAVQIANELGYRFSALRHEVANQIGLLRGDIDEIIEEYGLLEPLKTELQQIKMRLLGLSKRLDQAKDISEIMSHQGEEEIINVNDLLNEIIEEFNKTMTNMRFSTKSKLNDPALVKAPENVIYISLRELITNAIKALNGVKNACIEVCAIDDADNVILKVTDNGPGIPVNDRAAIFSPFCGKRDSNSQISSGFGLWAVKREIERLGGHIYLDETYEQGARFVIILPRYKK